MKKQNSNSLREEYSLPEHPELKFTNSHQSISQYIHFLRTQIKHVGTQIDSEFHRASEFIFSLYKHYYSPQQHSGQKHTLLNKLSNCGVQWALQSSLEQKQEEIECRSEEPRSANPTPAESREQDTSKRAYNMRAKSKPQKYRNMEDDYDYGQRSQRVDAPKRGRPSIKKQNDLQVRRDMTNPYEKAPYKKRRSHIQLQQDPKDESLKGEDVGRSSAKWQQSEEYKEEGNEVGKSAQEERSEMDREPQGASEKAIKSFDDVGKGHVKGDFQGQGHISSLVQSYKKSWHSCKLQIQLQEESVA